MRTDTIRAVPHSTRDEGLSDRELWWRSTEGDADAFGIIFRRHANQINSYCARRIGVTQAEDMVSIVFLESWRRRKEVRMSHDSALPWLYGVAINVIRDTMKSERRKLSALVRLHAQTDDVANDHADAVVGAIDDGHRLDVVPAALAELSPSDQDVLLLCVWQNLNYLEAALALGVPVGTVKSRLARARTRLSSHIDAKLSGDRVARKGGK